MSSSHVVASDDSGATEVLSLDPAPTFDAFDLREYLEMPYGWVRRVCANLATSHLRRRLVERRALLRTRGSRRSALPAVVPEVDQFCSGTPGTCPRSRC